MNKEIHWEAFSGSFNPSICEATDDPEKVTCVLCKEWMARVKGISNANDAKEPS